MMAQIEATVDGVLVAVLLLLLLLPRDAVVYLLCFVLVASSLLDAWRLRGRVDGNETGGRRRGRRATAEEQ